MHQKSYILRAGPSSLNWRYYNAKKAVAQKLIRSSLPGPSYCREDLPMIEKTWTPNKTQQNAFAFMSKAYYEHVYAVLREGAKAQITPQQARVQVAVIEECHRQNPLSKLPRNGWSKGK